MKKIIAGLAMTLLLLINLSATSISGYGDAARHYRSDGAGQQSAGFFDTIVDWFNGFFYYDDSDYGYDDDADYFDNDYSDYGDENDEYGVYDEDDNADYSDYDGYGDYDDYGNYDEEVLAVYLIEDGDLDLYWGEASDSEEALYEKMWTQAASLIPDDYESLIIKFEITTDGTDGSVAYIYNEDDSLLTWTFGLDPVDSVNRKGNFRSDFDETVIHEFAHLLTLSYDQMDASARNTYVAEEGRLKVDSYLNMFYQTFWTDIIDEHKQNVDEESEDYIYDFYLDHPNMFVNDYAATNPEEDIAESFTTFILNDRPTGNQISDQKLLFFYQFSKLVEMREEIRGITD